MAALDDIDTLVQPGQVLAGKYRIEQILGRGGMGVVVAAHHLQLDEKVAIKFLLPAAVARADLLQRFEREARAAVKIKSEHVARVIDVGVLDTGAPYMVMEFLDGVDLAARIAAEGRMSVLQTADFVLQACEAIVEAHALGIVHRDLKPANLFVTRRADGLEVVKVLDFGISKSAALSGSGGSDMTQTQSMLGSPFYMSPEQMQSARNVDMRTDIWALGCILYQCVAGEVPFEAETLPELVLKIVQSPPRPMQEYRLDVPPAFEQVIHYCLQKNRDHRYQHIGDLATGLVPFASERSRSSAERILRVVHASGIGQGVQPKLPPSSANLEAAKLATFKVQAVNPPYPNAADSSPTGPGGPPASLFDSRSRPSQVGGAPSQGGATMGMGPPPNTLPPGARSTGSHPNGFGVTSSSGTWGNSSNNGIPRTSGAMAFVAVGGAVIVLLGVVFVAVFFGRSYFAARTGDVHADAAASAPVVATAVPVVMASVQPSAEPETPDAGVVATTATPDAGGPGLTLTPIPPAPQPTPHPGPTPVGPTPQAPTAKPPAANCNPPYYYDAQGNRAFKKECL